MHNRYRREGGEDAVVRAEASLLRDAGHEVVRLEDENPRSQAGAALKLARAPWNARAAQMVRTVAEHHRPDVAHVHNTWFALTPAVLTALRQARVPVVMTLHNYRLLCANAHLFRDGRPCELCVGSHPWHGVVHRCYNHSALTSIPAAATIALNRRRGTWTDDVQVFLALTEFARDRFVAGGLPPGRIDVRPHFVADPGPRAQPPSAGDYLLYVGRLGAEKGVGTVVDAATRLGDVDLVVAGDGDDRAELEARAGPRVRFVGHVTPGEVQRLMLGARALVFPSMSYEAFGLVLVEAMAAGLPVLASDLGGTPDLVGAHAGLLLPPGDTDAWTAAFRLDEAFLDAAGRAGREQWAARFSTEVALAAQEKAYLKAIGRAAMVG